MLGVWDSESQPRLYLLDLATGLCLAPYRRAGRPGQRLTGVLAWILTCIHHSHVYSTCENWAGEGESTSLPPLDASLFLLCGFCPEPWLKPKPEVVRARGVTFERPGGTSDPHPFVNVGSCSVPGSRQANKAWGMSLCLGAG